MPATTTSASSRARPWRSFRYLEEHWRTPGWRADYDSWWPVIQRYAGVLATESFTGRGALKRLKALLNQNQNRPAIDL